MKQGRLSLDAYIEQYCDQVQKLRYLHKCPEEDVLCTNFLLSLSQSHLTKHVLDLLHDNKVPATLEETVQHICSWDETERVALRMMGTSVSAGAAKIDAAEELAHSADAKPATQTSNRRQRRGRGKGKGAATQPGADKSDKKQGGAKPKNKQSSVPAHGGCSHCKALGHPFWKGHPTAECRKKKAAEAQSAHVALDEGALDEYAYITTASVADIGVLALDTAATKSIIRDECLAKGVYSGPPVTVTGVNSQSVLSDLYCTTEHFGEALYAPTASANLVSFEAIKDQYNRTYDEMNNKFILTAKSTAASSSPKRIEFLCNEKGLFVYSTYGETAAATEVVCAAMTVDGVTYTPEQVRRAKEFLHLHEMLSHPSDAALSIALDNKCYPDCDLVSSDVRNARKIFGAHCIGCLIGKMTRPVAPPSNTEPAATPGQVLHCDVIFLYDVKSRKVPYLLTVDGHTGFIVVARMHAKSTAQLEQHLVRIINFYRLHQHVVRTVRSDRENVFASVRDVLAREGVQLLQSAPEQHEQRAERAVRVIKERMRSTYHSLPYTLPRKLFPYLLEYIAGSLNMTPNVNTGNRTPRDIVMRARPETGPRSAGGVKPAGVTFGSLVMCRAANLPANADLAPRAEHCLMVGRDSRNNSYIKAYQIHTGEVVIRRKFVSVPFTPPILALLNGLSVSDPAFSAESAYDESSFEFVDPTQPPVPVIPADERAAAEQPAVAAAPDPEPPARVEVELPPVFHVPSATEEAQRGAGILADELDDFNDGNVAPALDHLSDNSRASSPLELPDLPDESVRAPPAPATAPLAPPAAAAPLPVPAAPDPVPPPPVRTHGYNLRENPRASLRTTSAYHVSIEAAMRDNPADATAAVESELLGMIKHKVFEGVLPDDVRKLDKKQILPSMLFMKRKVDAQGKYKNWKGRLVAGGHRQERAQYSPQDSSSPTVTSAAVFGLFAVAARNDMQAAVIDVTAAYLNAPIGRDNVFIRLTNQVTETLVRLRPEYHRYVDPRTGCLVVRLKRALYGLIESAKLWNEHLTATLTTAGWTASKVDPCVMHRVDDTGDMHYLCIHVDDIVVFSRKTAVLESVADVLRKKYDKVSMSTGNSLEYLGIKFDFDRRKGCVKVSQPGYVRDILDSYAVKGHAKTPATADLFNVDPNAAPTDYTDFISKVMKLMFLALRSRPDILLATTFLASRCSAPTVQDMYKLKRVLMYLNGTQNLCLKLSPPRKSPLQMYAYVDASYACHQDAKSHTGVEVTLGPNCGPIYVHSAKQRIVTKSSYESELVAINDALDMVMFIRRLFLELGLIEGPTILYQDNQSTIHVIYNGVGTRGRTRHIDVRYYYIRERVAAGDIVVQYLASTEHTADILTKPLVGALFYKLRQAILNV
jgi:hypothetical protein